ncbi:MAG: PKD domain-containing protein, partial [Thermoplasmatales archaeon]|nr:PKD domain-containing protein [Thermoplasmatales archaeon]
EPGTYQYPYVIPDHGTTINICGQEVEIPDLIECGEDEYYVIIWDFREAWYFELHDGENITIEFTTNMIQYCECYNVDFAFAIGWGCYICDPCNYYLDWDCARVNCSPPETKFSKKVWDVEEGLWADEGFGVVGQEMEFKLEFEYYGNDVLTDIRFKDVLPCVLEFSEVIESTINISVWVSEDKKLIWFNMSEDTVEDCDVVIIRFTALVTGVTGDCCPDPAKNRVWLYIYECTGQIIDEYYDEVCLTTRENVPPCPPDITGDTYGIVDQKLTFQALASDPNGDDIYYMFDWGDETYSEWLGPYNSGEEVETNNSWNTIGEYEVKAKAKDTFGAESDWSPYPLIVEIVNNPPTASVINGPTNGDVGTSYPYTFTSTDPDGDQVSYYIDWGDGTTPVWSSFQASGATYSASHTWTSKGTYIIQAKAKDTFGEESDWSDPLTVEIVEPGTPKLSVKIKRGGLRREISLDIENTGDVDVNDITWNITVTRRGLIKKTLLQCNGTISALEPGSKETVTKSPFGISLITVTVEIDAPGIDHIDPISATVKGFLILRFVRLRR